MESKIDTDLELKQREKGGYVFLTENLKNECKSGKTKVSTLSTFDNL